MRTCEACSRADERKMNVTHTRTLSSMRLLVIEDDPVIARVLRRGLTENAYAIDVVDNGERALELANINAYDAMVLDLMIPGADGFEVCRRFGAPGPHPPGPLPPPPHRGRAKNARP